VAILVSSVLNGQLQVTGDNTMLLVIAGGITGELTAASEGNNTMFMGGITSKLTAASDDTMLLVIAGGITGKLEHSCPFSRDDEHNLGIL
jgi:hypothetical protein